MATETLELKIELEGIQAAERGLGGLSEKIDDADKGTSKLSSGLGLVGKAAIGLGIGAAVSGVTALGSAIAGGVADARDAAITFAQTEAVIKSTGGAAGVTAEQVADYAASLSAASGASLFGDDQIQQSTNLLLTFTNIKDVTLEAATAMSVDMAQALGGEPKDAAIQLGKALNDPIKGVTALTRVGVTFTEEQKAQIATMVEAGDVAGAQAVILAELNKEFGGSAAAAAEADGGMAQFNDRMGELAESVGAMVLPILNDLMGWMAGPGMDAIEGITAAVSEGLGVAFDWLGTNVLPALQRVFEVVWPAIQGAVNLVYTYFKDIVWPFWKATFDTFTRVVLPDLQAAFDEVWPKIQAAIDAVYQFMSTVVWPWIQNTALPIIRDTVLPALQFAFEVAWTAISAAVETTYLFLRDTVWPWIRDTAWPMLRDDILPPMQLAFEQAWSAISVAVKTVYDLWVGTVWPGISEAYRVIREDVLPPLGAAFTAVWGADDNSGIRGVVNRGQQAINTVRLAISTVKTVMETGWDAIQTAWEGFWSAINTAMSPVVRAFEKIADFIDTIKNFKPPDWMTGGGQPEGESGFGDGPSWRAPDPPPPPPVGGTSLASAATNMVGKFSISGFDYSASHPGVDLGNVGYAPIRAWRALNIYSAGYGAVEGNYAFARDARGFIYYLGHGNRPFDTGSFSPGQVFGQVGMTGRASGPHVHFEVRRPGGGYINPHVHSFAQGGWINEPVVGVGMRSGDPYTLAENGPEFVSNGGGGITVNVFPSPGMDERALAEFAVQAMDRANQRRRFR